MTKFTVQAWDLTPNCMEWKHCETFHNPDIVCGGYYEMVNQIPINVYNPIYMSGLIQFDYETSIDLFVGRKFRCVDMFETATITNHHNVYGNDYLVDVEFYKRMGIFDLTGVLDYVVIELINEIEFFDKAHG